MINCLIFSQSGVFDLIPHLMTDGYLHFLKIGPATASAVLACYSPSDCPFMSDEAMGSIPTLGKIEVELLNLHWTVESHEFFFSCSILCICHEEENPPRLF